MTWTQARRTIAFAVVLAILVMAFLPSPVRAAGHDQPSQLPTSEAAIVAAACGGFLGALGAAVGATGVGAPVAGVAFVLCFVTVGNHQELIGIRD